MRFSLTAAALNLWDILIKARLSLALGVSMTHLGLAQAALLVFLSFFRRDSHAQEFRNIGTSTAYPTGKGHQYGLFIGARRVVFDPDNPEDLKRLQLALALGSDDAADEPTHQTKETKQARRGLRELRQLAGALLKCTDKTEQLRLKELLLETAGAVNNLRRPPVPETVDFFQTPFFFLERLSRPVAQGRTGAANLAKSDESDPSRADPTPSLFWVRPANIPAEGLFNGVGRTNLLLQDNAICTYAGAKESFGRNPGFDVDWAGTKLKLKFAEVSSEPFATRIFAALGYHTDPTDYARTVKVRYCRQLLQEFNSRKPLNTHFTFLGLIPLFTLQMQQHYDPFEYLSAVLTNGLHWSGADLKRNLFKNASLLRPEEQQSNFRPEIESAIAYLETAPANVQLKEGKTIGPWDFESLDHCARRELRGAGLLAAWVGWFDTRFDNTRLRVLKHQGKTELVGYFSDLGGVLGETTGILYARGELPNAFPWAFTRPPLAQGAHRLAKPLRLYGYKPIAATPAFAAMNLDDARWMARLIGALSEEQIKQALIASGFDAARVRLYLEKLISRRDQMIRDLGLAHEIRLLRPSGIDRHFSYNPASDGAIVTSVQGKLVQAPAGKARILNCKLVE